VETPDSLPANSTAARNGEGFIPGFRIEKLIGKGGMGAVYKARKLNIGKTVALKVLFPSHEGDVSGHATTDQRGKDRGV
jgi:serine/threonine protein kinase